MPYHMQCRDVPPKLPESESQPHHFSGLNMLCHVSVSWFLCLQSGVNSKLASNSWEH